MFLKIYWRIFYSLYCVCIIYIHVLNYYYYSLKLSAGRTLNACRQSFFSSSHQWSRSSYASQSFLCSAANSIICVIYHDFFKEILFMLIVIPLLFFFFFWKYTNNFAFFLRSFSHELFKYYVISYFLFITFCSFLVYKQPFFSFLFSCYCNLYYFNFSFLNFNKWS